MIIVLLVNRQPTLHKPGIMAHKVCTLPLKRTIITYHVYRTAECIIFYFQVTFSVSEDLLECHWKVKEYRRDSLFTVKFLLFDLFCMCSGILWVVQSTAWYNMRALYGINAILHIYKSYWIHLSHHFLVWIRVEDGDRK